jgi:hypothetical protein
LAQIENVITRGKDLNIDIRPRVLLAGMHTEENSFSRQIKKLGVEVIWQRYPGGLPTFCDAAVITKAQCSHQLFWDTKELYGTKLKKPIFVVDHSFVTVKEKFETWLAEWRKSKQKPPTVMELAMKNATVINPPAKPAATDENAISRMKVRYTPEMKQKIKDTVHAHYKAGMSLSQAAEQMNKMGLTLASGGPIKLTHVSVWRCTFGLTAADRPKVETSQEPKRKRGPDATVYELILHANLPAEETMKLMRKLADGQLDEEKVLNFIELYTELKG